MKIIGLYGGTFDPIHIGHLRPAVEVFQHLKLDKLFFIPCAYPPHKTKPFFTIQQRIKLLQAAIGSYPEFEIDQRETQRPPPSYTIDTLKSLRNDFPDAALCLIIGKDAFNNINSWHQWHELLNFAHLIVTQRPHEPITINDEISAFFRLHNTQNITKIQDNTCGCIYMQKVTQFDISSTQIRTLLETRHDVRYLVPDKVYEIINN